VIQDIKNRAIGVIEMEIKKKRYRKNENSNCLNTFDLNMSGWNK
jgi:hypothetical protein